MTSAWEGHPGLGEDGETVPRAACSRGKPFVGPGITSTVSGHGAAAVYPSHTASPWWPTDEDTSCDSPKGCLCLDLASVQAYR